MTGAQRLAAIQRQVREVLRCSLCEGEGGLNAHAKDALMHIGRLSKPASPKGRKAKGRKR